MLFFFVCLFLCHKNLQRAKDRCVCRASLHLLFMVAHCSGCLNSGPWNRWFFFHRWGCCSHFLLGGHELCFWIRIYAEYSARHILTLDNFTCRESWCPADRKWSDSLLTDGLFLCFKSKQDWSSISSRSQGNWQAAAYLWPCCRPLSSWIPVAAKHNHLRVYGGWIYSITKGFLKRGIYVFYIWDGASGYCKRTILNDAWVR